MIQGGSVTGSLCSLGHFLRTCRTEVYREGMRAFAARLGVTTRTLVKMESGNPNVRIGTWMRAFEIMQVAQGVVHAAKPGSALLQAMSRDAEMAFPTMNFAPEPETVRKSRS